MEYKDYFSTIESALAKRESLTNESANEATIAIREVTEFLNAKGIINFTLIERIDYETGIDFDFNVHQLLIGLHWWGGKIMMSFEDEDREPVLGLKRQQRIYVHKYLLEKFMKQALNVIENTPLDECVQN